MSKAASACLGGLRDNMLTLRLCLIDSLESSIDVLWERYDR